MDIFGEELLFEAGSKEAADHQKYQGAEQNDPAVRDGAPDQPVVKAVEAPFALLLNREFLCFRRSLDVVAQEGNEGHGDNERAQQGSGHHDRKAFEELTGIACEHQEREIGDDVGDGGKEDRRREFRRTEPRRNSARKAVCKASLDPVARDHRHIDQKSQRDNERCHGNLLEIDA